MRTMTVGGRILMGMSERMFVREKRRGRDRVYERGREEREGGKVEEIRTWELEGKKKGKDRGVIRSE